MDLIRSVPPSIWITIAGTLFTLGYLIINQVILRLMILAGSLAYLAYYLTAADEPLWSAMVTTGVMMLANVIGLSALYLRNSDWTVPKKYRDIYPLLQPISPGDFRSLMRHARYYDIETDTIVTQNGEVPDKVYFVISGQFQATKFGMTFPMGEHTFVGEVAYLMDSPSAATTLFPAGLQVVEWDRAKLAKRSRRNPRFKLALEAVMSRDLAKKVALAVAPPTQ